MGGLGSGVVGVAVAVGGTDGVVGVCEGVSVGVEVEVGFKSGVVAEVRQGESGNNEQNRIGSVHTIISRMPNNMAMPVGTIGVTLSWPVCVAVVFMADWAIRLKLKCCAVPIIGRSAPSKNRSHKYLFPAAT